MVKKMSLNKLLKEPFLVLGAIFSVTTIVLVTILVLSVTGGKSSIDNDVNTNIGITDNTEEVVDYILRDSATDYQKQVFEELTAAQESFEDSWTPETESAYAEAVVKNFIADFYTWSNKLGRNDVGGLQFVYPLYRTDFRNKAVDVFYLYLDYYIEEYGADELLTVTDVKVTGVDTNYVYTMPDGTQLDGTYVYVEWAYDDSQELDLSKFPTETGFVVVEKDNQLVLIEIQEW